jgi:hypothetical protein
MAFDRSLRSKLTSRDIGQFQGDTLFSRIARVLCGAACLPRKELYETWEVARRARRRFRGGRVVDLACGHGLLAHVMLLLDTTATTAVAADRSLSPSAAKISAALTAAWPQLEGRVTLVPRTIAEVAIGPRDVVVSAHACGGLTDEVLTVAIAARARVVVLPCCHDVRESDTGGVTGWCDKALAIDVTRAARLRGAGYSVYTQVIPEAITPKNRLLLGEPR